MGAASGIGIHQGERYSTRRKKETPMSEFRRHDKIQLWLNRPVPWNAISSYVQSPESTGDWMLGSTLIAGVHRFVSAPLPKPLTRHVSLTWIYLGTDEQTELQVKIDTSDYPISVVAESVIRMLITRTQRMSQDTEHIPSQWAGRIVDINPELSV